jgi:hypothetical protein
MVDFLLFAFASVGMMLILVRGTLFQPFRQFLADRAEQIRIRREEKGQKPHFTLTEFLFGLISCAQCMGFWCGLFCGVFFITSDTCWLGFYERAVPEVIPNEFNGRYLFNRILMLFCCGTAGSFFSVAGDIFVEWLFYSKMLLMRRFDDEEQHRTMLSEQSAHFAETIQSMPEEINSAE